MIQELIHQMHALVAEFAERTQALSVEFVENKKSAEWSIKYNIIKLEFVLTKKDKILCSVATLFCRVYLGKNETIFYHLPELMEYLEPDNFQCYYFSYIESKERIEACFATLSAFLCKHMSKISEWAKDAPKSDSIRADKIAEVKGILEVKENEEEVLAYALDSYEAYVLLPRYAAEGPYREYVCGNYEKAIKTYEQMQKKGTLTRYEERLVEFIKRVDGKYTALSEACNSIYKAKLWNLPSKEGLSILLMALVCEVLFALLFAGIILILNAILSEGTVYYIGEEWYYAFLWAGLPAIFGGIAFRNGIRRFLQKDIYEEGRKLEKMMNPKWVDPFANTVFTITFVGALVISICTTCMSTRFYEEHMVYNTGELLIPVDESCNYQDLKTVYYSKGLYNVYGDFIDRPSYLLEFSDGRIWDSDGFTSIEVCEKHILPLLEEYYEKIEQIESRNELIDR